MATIIADNLTESKRLRAYIAGALRGTDETARKEKTMTNTIKTPKTYSQIHTILIQEKPRSAWSRGVNNVGVDIVGEILENANGNDASHFNHVDDFSKHFYGVSLREAVYGGCFLIYNSDIAENFCTPSELKRTKNGEYNPNRSESWLDVMYRGAYQAIRHIITLQ